MSILLRSACPSCAWSTKKSKEKQEPSVGAGSHKPERATLKLDLYATAFLLSGLFLDILEHFFPRK